MADYPEHDRLAEVAEHSQEIGRFLDEFLPSKGIHLAIYSDARIARGELVPAPFTINGLLAEFYDIDLNKIEAEKRAMLASLRAIQEA